MRIRVGLGFLCKHINPCHLRPCAQSRKGGSLRPGAIFHTLILRGIWTVLFLLQFLPHLYHPHHPGIWDPALFRPGSEAADDQCSSLLSRTSALPPLDWPLPSQYEQLELRIEVQPRAHHRAHYETEGSRGAVKAAPGGHPVVKVRGRGQA